MYVLQILYLRVDASYSAKVFHSYVCSLFFKLNFCIYFGEFDRISVLKFIRYVLIKVIKNLMVRKLRD